MLYRPRLKRRRWRLRWVFVGRVMVWLLATWLVGLVLLPLLIVGYGQFDHARPVDVIIVLGSGLREDGTPGPALTRRSTRGAVLWQEGIAAHIICTGGVAWGQVRSEADGCRDVLLENGIPNDVIILEETAKSTEENAIYSRAIMQENGWDTAVIVSDRYHLLRARLLFWLRGVTVYTSPVDGYPDGLTFVYAMAREVAALHWQVVKEVFGVNVTHIPVL